MTKWKLFRFSTRSVLIFVAILSVTLFWFGAEYLARLNALLAIRKFEQAGCLCTTGKFVPDNNPTQFIVESQSQVDVTWSQIWYQTPPTSVCIPADCQLKMAEIDEQLKQMKNLHYILIDSRQNFEIDEIRMRHPHLDFHESTIQHQSLGNTEFVLIVTVSPQR